MRIKLCATMYKGDTMEKGIFTTTSSKLFIKQVFNTKLIKSYVKNGVVPENLYSNIIDRFEEKPESLFCVEVVTYDRGNFGDIVFNYGVFNYTSVDSIKQSWAESCSQYVSLDDLLEALDEPEIDKYNKYTYTYNALKFLDN